MHDEAEWGQQAAINASIWHQENDHGIRRRDAEGLTPASRAQASYGSHGIGPLIAGPTHPVGMEEWHLSWGGALGHDAQEQVSHIPPPPPTTDPPAWVWMQGAGHVAGWQFSMTPHGRMWANLADLAAWIALPPDEATSSHHRELASRT